MTVLQKLTDLSIYTPKRLMFMVVRRHVVSQLLGTVASADDHRRTDSATLQVGKDHRVLSSNDLCREQIGRIDKLRNWR